jgi:WD40 repeat protein
VLKTNDTLPGIVERPTRIPGVKRWNVDTLWPRAGAIVARYSPDGRWLAVGAMDGHVRIYSADAMELITLLPGRSGEHGVMDLSWHPDSHRLAVAADGDGTSLALRIWTREGEPRFEETTSTYGSVAWSHSGEWLADASLDRLVLRQAEGTVVKVLLEGPGLGAYRGGSLAWSPDDVSLACRHLNGDVRIWNRTTGDSVVLVEQTAAGFSQGFGVEWGSAGWLAVTDREQLRLFHPESGESRVLKFGSTRTVAWQPDGRRGLLADGYLQLHEWSVDEGATTRTLATDWFSNQVLAVAPDGGRVASIHRGVVVLNEHLEEQFRSPQSARFPSNLAWSRDGREVVATLEDSTQLRRWTPTGKALETQPLPTYIGRLKAGPDNNWLAFAGNQPGLWMLTLGQSPRQLLAGRCGSADWSPDGRFIAAGVEPGVVMVFRPSGEVVAEMSAAAGETVVAWSPDSTRLAVHAGQQVFTCDVAAGWKLVPGSVTSTSANRGAPPLWAPDGQRFSIEPGGWFDLRGELLEEFRFPVPRAWRPDGKQYAAWWLGLYRPSGTREAERSFNGNTSTLVPQYHPRGHLLAMNYGQSMLTAARVSDLEPYWHILLLPGERSATFSPAGELLDGDPAEVDQFLRYYVDRGEGRIELLTPAEFRTVPQDAAR